MTARRLRALLVVAALATASAACSDDGGGDDADGDSSSSTTTTVDLTAPLAQSAPGTGRIALGAQELDFEITSCAPSLPADAPPDAKPRFELEGTGTGRGGEFTVTISRYESEAQEQTFTDTITYEDEARIYEAQRIEVNSVITDLRDPNARTPLLTLDGDRVVGAGTAGPRGEEAAAGLHVRVDATCAPTA